MSLLLNSVTSPSEWDFDPRSFPDCAIWFDAADTDTITGTSPVTAWRNKGSIVMDAVNDVGTCVSGAGTINGRNYISCPQGTNLAFTCALTTQPRSIFLVLRGQQQLTTQFYAPITRGTASLSQMAILFSRSSSTSYHYNLGLSAWTSVKVNAQSIYGSSPGTFSMLVNPVPSMFNKTTVYGFVNSTAAPATANCISVNGIEYRTNTQPTTLTTSVAASGYDTANIKYTINTSDTSATYNTGMDYCEILYYNRVLGDTERKRVEGYLAWKWGVAVNDFGTTPLSVPNCLSWYDADIDFSDATSRATSFTFSAGNSVQTWLDKSGNGRTATSITTGKATLTENVTNGKCGVSFIGATTLAALTSTLSLGTDQSCTLFVVATGLSFGGIRGLCGVNAYPGTTGGYIFLQQNASNPGVWQWTGGTGFEGFTTGVPLGVARADIVSAIWSPGSCQYTTNGLPQPTSSTTPTVLTSGGQLLIGALATGTTLSNGWAGNVHEIIIYVGIVSDDDRARIERYLATKWNITYYSGTLAKHHPARYWRPFHHPLNPLEQGTCTLWLDGADSSTSSVETVTGTVFRWNDKSGNQYNATAVSAATRPTYANNLVTFSGDRRLNFNQSALNNSTGLYAIFLVINPVSSSNWILTKQFDGVDTTNVLSTTIYSDSTGAIVTGATNQLFFKTSNSRTIFSSSGAGITPSTLQILALICNPSGTMALYVNGTLNVSRSGTWTVTDNIAANSCLLGAFSASGVIQNSGVTNFSLGELLIYNSTPTRPYTSYYGFDSGFRQRIEGYLAWKWGLEASLPTTHPFYPTRLRPDSFSVHPLQTQNAATFDTMLWLDAADPNGDRTLPASGSSIAEWVDKSGNSKTCYQSVVSQRPTFTYDNGYPAISFDRTFSQYLQSSAALLSGSSYNAYTIFAVFRIPTGVNNMSVFFLPKTALSTVEGSAIYTQLRTPATTSWQWSMRYNTTTTKTFTTVPQTVRWLTCLADNGIALSTNPGTVSYNGLFTSNLSVTGAINLSANDSGNSRYIVGAQCFSSTYAAYASVFVHEIMVFRRQLGDPERQWIEGYLSWKWGIPLNTGTSPYIKVKP